LLGDVAPYALRVSQQLSDLDWDRFVEATHGGAYQQSSRWAQVKSTVNWRCIRLILFRDDQIVAGCQALVRSFARVGSVAYVSRGPLVADSDPGALAAILEALQRLVKEERLLYLKLQPPWDRNDMPAVLRNYKFVRSGLDTAPSVTTRVDLRQSTDDMLAAMHTTARRNIRQAQRRGVVIREGGGDDLPVFYELVEATSRRQKFAPYPQSYFEHMWRVFNEKGHAHLLLAEYQGEPLASVLLIGFGDSVVYKMGGWSGANSSIRPNELLHWTGMQWGRDRGHQYYDLEGIDRSVGEALLAEPGRIRSPLHGTTRFKLGFGGEVVRYPGTYDYASHPLFGLPLRWLAPNLGRLTPVAHRVLGRRKATRRAE
jgi:peptidoglycan pentaglycine glycine transferase (the first glycine)